MGYYILAYSIGYIVTLLILFKILDKYFKI